MLEAGIENMQENTFRVFTNMYWPYIPSYVFCLSWLMFQLASQLKLNKISISNETPFLPFNFLAY